MKFSALPSSDYFHAIVIKSHKWCSYSKVLYLMISLASEKNNKNTDIVESTFARQRKLCLT